MRRASDGSDTPARIRSKIPDLLRAIPVKVYVKDGNISNETTMIDSIARKVSLIFDTFGRSVIKKVILSCFIVCPFFSCKQSHLDWEICC